jgi:nucleotide-binding universal stress UspA family protein
LISIMARMAARRDASRAKGRSKNMAIKDILVQLDASAASAARLKVACGLARQHEAHLHGLYVIDVAYSGSLLYADDMVATRLIEQLRAQAEAEAAQVEEQFRALMTTESVSHEWSLVEGVGTEIMAEHARYSDLCVMGQNDPANPSVTAGGTILEHVLFASGRPVLMVPYAGHFETIGQKVMIGWTPTRESTRAVHDAMPLIAPDAAVTILTVAAQAEDLGQRGALTAAIATHLARHGITVTAQEAVGGDISVADLMLNAVSDAGTDLLVIGAYGHSRIRELVMGGVTRTLLEQATVPVLMSH